MRIKPGPLAALVAALGIGAIGIGAAAATAPAAWAGPTSSAADAGPQNHHNPTPLPRVKPSAVPNRTASTGLRGPKAAAQASSLTIRRTFQGPVRLRRGSTAAAELSGIAYGGGTTYYAVGDNGATSIWQLDTTLNARSGRIGSALVSGGISAPSMGSDSEGIALAPDETAAWISDENDSSITQFSLLTGLMLSSVGVPSIYRPANVQGNFGLESLTYGADTLWTANEEALKSDGPLSTTAEGTWIRLQRFDGPDLTAASQYAYRTDPIAAMSPLTTAERSGVVDLLALPDGQVLALERELGGFVPHFRNRIYLVDFTGASDVSETPSLADGGFTPVTKTLLWQGVFGFANFEGITLGPRLNDGSYAVVLVSDDGQGQLGQRQSVISLKLRGLSTATAAAITA